MTLRDLRPGESGRITAVGGQGALRQHFLDMCVIPGMDVTVGNTASAITSVGLSADGQIFALADTDLADGVYDARVTYRRTQVMKLLFN